MSSWVLIISTSEDSKTCVSNLCQCMTHLTVKKKKNVFLHSNGISSDSVCAHCLLSYHWVIQRKVRLHMLYTLPSDFYTHWSDPAETSLSQTKLSQLSQHFLTWKMFQPLKLCSGLAPVVTYLLLGNPELDTALQMWPHPYWFEGKDHLP